jgi:formylglycine-generating enzyme required for sulfatase activity
MKHCLFPFFSIVAGVAFAVDPIVSNVTATQGLGSRKVTVSYTLEDEPAVITVDVQTNRGDDVWVSIGADKQVSITGDLNKLVRPGNHALVWNAKQDWPDQLIKGGNIRFAVSAWTTNAPPEWMVVDLDSATPADSVTYYESADRIPGGVSDARYKTTQMLFRKIPAGGVEWLMGSPDNESGRMTTERGELREKQHRVILTDDYYMAIFETTQKQYSKLDDSHTSSPRGDTYPLNRATLTELRGETKGLGWPTNHDVDDTSWFGKLRAATGLDFDLPTEAQWEFACRAGTTTAYCCGIASTGSPNSHVFGVPGIEAYAQYTYSSGNALQFVGQKRPNGYGLYDMMGNVNEMCLDWLGDYPNDGGVSVDPRGAAKPNPLDLANDSVLIFRGGYYNSIGDALRSANRLLWRAKSAADAYGFRVVCPAVAK